MLAKNMKKFIAGIPWYARDQYARVLAIMDDAFRLPATFDAWLSAAEQTAAEYERQGLTVYRILLEPESFLGWCKSRDFLPDAHARSIFASERAGLAARPAPHLRARKCTDRPL